MSDHSRREFLAGLAAFGVALRHRASARSQRSSTRPAAHVKVGYAAITWGGQDEEAINDIAEVGFKGIQLRASVLDRFGSRPEALRTLLKLRGLSFVALSSGNLRIDPEVEQEQIALHLQHAAFVRDAGGQYLQVIDEKPKDHPPGPADYTRVGHLLSELGRRTAAIGVPLVYHHHMNSVGEKPDAIAAILEAADPGSVSLLFDIAHYQQGGGDPVAAIRTFRNRIRVVHLKDVETTSAAPGYRWVELGRGRVDVKGAVAALGEIAFGGWAIVELDRVTDPAGSPKASAIANRDYVVKQLGLTV